MVLVSASCSPAADEYVFRGDTMGTYWAVKIVSAEPLDQLQIQKGIQQVLDDINAKMSNWEPESEVTLFNAATAGCTEISRQTAEVIQISEELALLSGGVFDITLGPLIELWGFGTEFTEDQVPESEAIQSRLAQIGYQKLHLEGTGLCKDDDNLYINLSATAKGYGVDQIAQYLESLDYQRFLVEVGGEVRVLGLNSDNQFWRIGIEAPLDQSISGQVQDVVELDNQALATSGDYRNFFVQDGVRYSHILDPNTGWPVPQTLASVSVRHDSAAWADAWATALLALGADSGLELADQQNVAAYFVVRADTGFEIRTSLVW